MCRCLLLDRPLYVYAVPGDTAILNSMPNWVFLSSPDPLSLSVPLTLKNFKCNNTEIHISFFRIITMDDTSISVTTQGNPVTAACYTLYTHFCQFCLQNGSVVSHFCIHTSFTQFGKIILVSWMLAIEVVAPSLLPAIFHLQFWNKYPAEFLLLFVSIGISQNHLRVSSTFVSWLLSNPSIVYVICLALLLEFHVFLPSVLCSALFITLAMPPTTCMVNSLSSNPAQMPFQVLR